jgi:hypothetical protein
MDFATKLILGQLVVLVVTGIVVVWYTYETSIIRRETTRQAALSPSATLWDRQNQLDRLVFSHPAVGREFMAMADRSVPYFTAPADVVPRDDLYCQLKAFVYLQLNFFEEIFLTTSASPGVASQFEREEWNSFIFHYMRHPLLREVFEAEKNRAYTGEFVRFMTRYMGQWDGAGGDADLF